MKISIFPHENFNFSSWNLLNYFSFNCPTHAYLLYIARIFDLRKQGARRLIQTWQIYLESINQEYVLKKKFCMALHRTQLISAREKSVVFRIYVEIRGPLWPLVFLKSAPNKFFWPHNFIMKIFIFLMKIFFLMKFMIFPFEIFTKKIINSCIWMPDSHMFAWLRKDWAINAHNLSSLIYRSMAHGG